jgi:hypothetical protein
MGVNAQNDVITGLNSQLTGLINESKAIPLQIQQNAQAGGANVTKGGLAPIQTAQLRNNAIQALSVSSLIDASRGALDVAMKKVDRALEAKYGPLEEANKARLANLDLLSKDPALTREEKARVDFLTAQTKASDAKIADAKAIETAKHDAVLKAYSAFSTNPKFDSITQAAINAAKTDTEVAQILEQSGLSTVKPDKAETQLTKLDNGETVLVDTQTGKIISRIGGAKVPEAPAGNTNVVIDGKPVQVNNNALSYAQQYASTGKLPSPAELKLSGLSVSEVTQIAKGLPKPDGALIDNNTGVKPSNLSAAQEAGITAMNEIVTKTMPALKDRFGKIATGLVGGIGGMIWTSQDRQDYDTFRQEFLSKLLVARSGAAVTEQEYARYAKMLPSNFNQLLFLGSDGSKKLNALDTSMKTNLDSTLNTNQVNIVGYSDIKKQLDQLSPEQLAELGDTLPAWYVKK